MATEKDKKTIRLPLDVEEAKTVALVLKNAANDIGFRAAETRAIKRIARRLLTQIDANTSAPARQPTAPGSPLAAAYEWCDRHNGSPKPQPG